MHEFVWYMYLNDLHGILEVQIYIKEHKNQISLQKWNQANVN